MALSPNDMDFIQNFSTLWAVFLGALLATIGGFTATQLEWYLERRRREKNAALFFGEVLSTMHILLGMATRATTIGDPYGPITLRLFRSALGEVEIYNRNRETLYDLRDATLRARIHTLMLRVGMSVDGIFDFTNTLAAVRRELEHPAISVDERSKLETRVAGLETSRQGSLEFVQENAELMTAIIKQLEPMAGFSFENVEKAVRNA
ncbi:MAG: hypothetical protein JO348_10445 [Alphaproteobacteria bacterium]|nr:hypothetical protein [Alphaproteobacteria bacterium]MBV9420181.1 hypothetical protein [Alphaproteobacteria bacterium]MBV9540447.1 hypothetical protein [Alphaproteobacteria bacterium]